MKVHGKMLVKNFRKLFLDEFGVAINVHNGFSTGSFADDGESLSAIRSEKAGKVTGEVDLHGNMTVGTAEKAIAEGLVLRFRFKTRPRKTPTMMSVLRHFAKFVRVTS